ncbi:MAG: hypothetical protein Q9166_002269 [cf. Caloplaca sp. 2 TL-2023]
MDGEVKEVSPEPSTRGLKSVLTKARRGGRNNASKVSVNGTDNSGSIRSSIDSSHDRIRASRGSSLDEGLSTNNTASISKLIPNRIQKKRNERKAAKQAAQEQDELDAQEEDGRGRSISQQAATAAAPLQRSRSTLGEEASLLTNDSEDESPLSPPPLVSHQSHIGYLTSSSPLIKTTTAADNPDPSCLSGPTFQSPQYQKAATFAITPPEPSEPASLTPQHAATMEPVQPGSSSNTKDAESKADGRGVSPGTRIKDVFKSGSKKKAESPPHSPDRASIVSTGSVNTLGSMLAAERQNSSKPRTVSQANMNPSQSTQNNIRTSNVVARDLPPISTTPKTPTSAGLQTPLTTVTPPTPTDQRSNTPVNSPVLKQTSNSSNPNVVTSLSGDMTPHRRVRSETGGLPPSKLANAVFAPLTPTIEEGKTPGARTPGAQGSPGSSGGFFSSLFTTAQNAANTLTNTISNQPQRPKSAPIPTEEGNKDLEESSVLVEGAEGALPVEKKPLAIDTLGSGDLSLDHLGISSTVPDTSRSSIFPSSADGLNGRGVDGQLVQRDEATARVEDAQAARAVSAAYSEKTAEPASTPVAEDGAGAKPMSIHENSVLGDRTPPNGSIFEGEKGVRRSGSVRSRVGAVARRHRNSSSVTANTIGAAIAAGHAGLANPSVNGSTLKLTGFAVASKKRNKDFHQNFRSVPEDDYLIEDYSCALQKEILLAGRLYVSEGHICFSSNILGWVTTVIISFDEIVSVEKENTAMVFPNAIAVQTLQARHTFRSLLSREATYELLIGIWKLSHPNLRSSLNGARIEAGGTGDKTEKVEPSGSDDGSDISEEEEVYDEDEEDGDEAGSIINNTAANTAANGGDDQTEPRPVSRKASNIGAAIGSAAGGVPTQSDGKAGDKAAAVSAATPDFPGPATHGPTECSDSDTHYAKVLKDEIIPAPLGKIYSMMFGAASGGFISKWMIDELKVTELQMEDDKKGLTEEKPTRFYSYIKPLYAAIGPKTTKCLSTENLDAFDLEKAVSVTITTQTPDVPSGNVFSVKTRYCLMWAPGNSTRVLVNCTVEWTGKSWLKGPIEKGANDGQQTYADDLMKALKAGVVSRARAGTGGSKLKKGKRRKGEGEIPDTSVVEKAKESAGPKQDNSWGVFEPLHGTLGPVADITSPLVSSNMIISFLVFLLVISWFRGPKARHAENRVGFSTMSSPERMAAYEEIWRTEESELWKWLEDRMEMHDISNPVSGRQKSPSEIRAQRGRYLQSQGFKAKMAEEAMNEREVDHAIRVTEEKLEALKAAMQQKKREKHGDIPQETPASSVEDDESGFSSSEPL